MKKLVAVFICLVMVIMTVFASAEKATVPDEFQITESFVLGSWYASGIGVTGEMLINPNRSVKLTLNDNTQSGLWWLENKQLHLFLDGEYESILTYFPTEKCFVNEDRSVTYGRSQTATYVGSKEVLAEDIHDFDGTWVLSIISGFGTTLSAEGLVAAMNAGGDKNYINASDFSMKIKNGVVTMFTGGDPIECVFDSGRLLFHSEYEVAPDAVTDEAPEGMDDSEEGMEEDTSEEEVEKDSFFGTIAFNDQNQLIMRHSDMLFVFDRVE